MAEGEAALVRGNAGRGLPEKLAIDVVSHFVGRPIEAVFVVALVWAEFDGRIIPGLLALDGGVDYEEEG